MDDAQLAWRTALHEAEHAILGRLLGLSCGGAVVAPADDASADVPVDVDARGILVLLGGAVAETLGPEFQVPGPGS